jgi:hypothetical protein
VPVYMGAAVWRAAAAGALVGAAEPRTGTSTAGQRDERRQLDSFRYSEKVDERRQEEESRNRQEQNAERTRRYLDGISTGDYSSYLRSLDMMLDG